MKFLAFGILLFSQLVFANTNETVCGTLVYGNYITENDGFSVQMENKENGEYLNITLVHSLESVNLMSGTGVIVTESSIKENNKIIDTTVASIQETLKESQKVCVTGILDIVGYNLGFMAVEKIRKN